MRNRHHDTMPPNGIESFRLVKQSAKIKTYSAPSFIPQSNFAASLVQGNDVELQGSAAAENSCTNFFMLLALECGSFHWVSAFTNFEAGVCMNSLSSKTRRSTASGAIRVFARGFCAATGRTRTTHESWPATMTMFWANLRRCVESEWISMIGASEKSSLKVLTAA
jgi:hypothetical protein